MSQTTPDAAAATATDPATPEVATGYAPVNGLQMYYELHGSGGTPLLLLHGGLFDIDQQFGGVLPGLSAGRRVIAADMQGHGRTNDADRPLATASLTDDAVALLQHLGVDQVDVFGYSIGGAVALRLAVRHPELVRKAVVSSVSFQPDGDREGGFPSDDGSDSGDGDGDGSGEPAGAPDSADGDGEAAEPAGGMTVDMIAGTPMEAAYLAKSPHPERLQTLLDKLVGYQVGEILTDDEIAAYPAPTLFTVGDCDAVKLEHAVRFLQLRGGDVNGDFEGVPANQLAVFAGTTHFAGMARPELILPTVIGFLDAPMPDDAPVSDATAPTEA